MILQINLVGLITLIDITNNYFIIIKKKAKQ